jgi:Protein of unknown function (DUF3054)
VIGDPSVGAIRRAREPRGDGRERLPDGEPLEERRERGAGGREPTAVVDEVPGGGPFDFGQLRQTLVGLVRGERREAEPTAPVPRPQPADGPAAEAASRVVEDGGSLHTGRVRPRGWQDVGVRTLLGARRQAVWLVVIGDVVALVAFVLIGIRSHHVATPIGFVRNAGPLLAAWFAVALLTRPYRRPGFRSLVRTWIVAVPIGLLVRTALVGSPTGGRLVVFLAVGLAVTLAFLVLGRVLVRLIARAQ